MQLRINLEDHLDGAFKVGKNLVEGTYHLERIDEKTWTNDCSRKRAKKTFGRRCKKWDVNGEKNNDSHNAPEKKGVEV